MQQLELTVQHELVDLSWPDRPDLVAKVFKIELDALVKEINSGHYFLGNFRGSRRDGISKARTSPCSYFIHSRQGV